MKQRRRKQPQKNSRYQPQKQIDGWHVCFTQTQQPVPGFGKKVYPTQNVCQSRCQQLSEEWG